MTRESASVETANASRDGLLFSTLYWMNRREFPAPTLVNQGGHWVVIVGWTTDVEPVAGSQVVDDVGLGVELVGVAEVAAGEADHVGAGLQRGDGGVVPRHPAVQQDVQVRPALHGDLIMG